MNVLFIVVDDLRPDLAGLYGDSHIFSPNIDRLMQSGVTFTRSYSQCPICSPSRTSFLSGLRPDTTRVWTIGPYFRETMPGRTGMSVRTLPQYFKEAGYHTVGGGKVFHPGFSSGGPSPTEGGGDEPFSWSEPYFFCDHFRNGTFQSPAMQNWPSGTGCVQSAECIQCLEAYHSWGTANSFKPAIAASECPSECYPEGAVAHFVGDTLRSLSSSQRPFFLAAGLKRPHLGWFAPQSFFDLYPATETAIATHREPPVHMPPTGFFMNNSELRGSSEFVANHSLTYTLSVGNEDISNISSGRYRLVADDFHSALRSAYFASVSWMDEQLGSILDALTENGLWSRTIIVFVGDHGYHLGENGAWSKNTPYEYSARVPMVFRVPGQMGNGSRAGTEGGFAVDAIVEMIDIFPTVLEAAGLERNVRNEGHSLMPYIRGGAGYGGENVAFTQCYGNGQTPPPPHSAIPPHMAMSVRVDGWRYTEYVAYDWNTAQPLWERGNFGVELYEHSEDTEHDWNSYEHYNVAYDAEYSEKVERFHRYIVEQWPYGPNATQQYPGDVFISPELSLYD